VAVAAGAQSPAPQNLASNEGKNSKIIEMQNEWLKAGSEGDNATIRGLLAQKWVAMAPSGYIMHYSDFEADHNDSRLPKLTMQHPNVEFYGTTAVLMSHLVTEKSGGPTFNVTSVFQDRMGKWEMIATHLSANRSTDRERVRSRAWTHRETAVPPLRAYGAPVGMTAHLSYGSKDRKQKARQAAGL
jgi:hypothetical protein